MTTPTGALPPEQLLMQMATGKWVSKALGLVAELGIPDRLSAGSRDVAALAAETAVHPEALYRLLRAAAAFGVLTELPERHFENNAVSNLLRSGVPGSLRGMARWLAEDSAWQAWGRLDYSVQTGEPAFDHVLGATVFDHFARHPASGQIFNDAMVSFTAVTGQAVVDAYDFSAFTTIVDVGGGHGALLAAIAPRYPRLRGVVFDRPEVAAGADALLASHGLADRVTAASGDFLQAVPVGADAYVMKHIIHDWDDARAARILANCAQAMAPGGTVLVVEQVVSDRPEAALSKLMDLEMLVMTAGGRERTTEEFSRLMDTAGLRMTRIVPTHSPVAVIEAVRA
jgi:2-polyprenyl-3-methyl-5-hydroxy-6-metoxy-1,4-benzoquinol methylase